MSIEHCVDCNVAIDIDFMAEDIEYIDDVPYCFNCFCRRMDEETIEKSVLKNLLIDEEEQQRMKDEKGKIAAIRLSKSFTDD